MSFGVKNAPAVFQELMNEVLREEVDFASPYMDDVVIFSKTWEDHTGHIRKVLGRLEQAGLTANPSKCYWGGKTIEFLGHQVGNGQMALTQHKIQALSSYTRPTTKRGLRAFLGAISFYRRYVKRLATQTAILTPLTAKTAPSKLEWTEEGERDFVCILKMICGCCSLCIPLPSDTFLIVSDAPGLGVGGVLQVWRGEQWEAAAFFSHQLRGAERRYSATELEALALVATVQHFAYYLYGKEFRAFKDHKPLLQLLTSDRLNSRLRRMAHKLQQWNIDISYIQGEQNGMADALSREERHMVQNRWEREEPETSTRTELGLAGGGCGGNTAT